ncbi:MAG: thiol peroxidase [Sarcina sp.]
MKIVQFKGNDVTLVGDQLEVGQKFPAFKAVGEGLAEFNFGDTEGVRIVLAVPSIDTPVCDSELKRMAKEVKSLDGIKLIAVSKDLPFAQSRWCVDVEGDDIQIVSDYKYADFANTTGTLIEELGLLGRVSFVVAKDGTIKFVEYLQEVGFEPSYDEILAAAKALV